MKPLPIRWKFAVSAAALVGLVLAIFAFGTYLNLYHEQIEAVDLALEAERQHLAAVDEPYLFDRTIDELVRFQPWLAIAIFDDARVMRRSDKLPEAVARAALRYSGVHTQQDAAGEPWRIVTVNRPGKAVVIAHTLSEVNEIIRDLFTGYALSLPIVLLVAAGGGWWMSGRALAPLRALTAAAEGVQASQLDRRVPVGAADDELRRLAHVFNAMLARLQTSFQQAQRFAADASHELRTPLTIMHGEIERLLRARGLERGPEEKLLSLQEEIGRLDRITEHLLLLAKFDAGNPSMTLRPIDAGVLVRAVCEDAEILAEAHQVSLETDIAAGVWILADDAQLRRALLTLLDNAARYNLSGGRVRCLLARRGPVAELRISNTGAGIPVEGRPHLFQRFFRGDPARSRGGHGLGLSLCREIVHAHRGEIELAAASPAGWTEFVVTLPCVEGAVSEPS
ncbi:ATP-binding protein [Horticoccus sp. 23ND18S-11]|uniref:ATP-binding protein n=1 Tax=Horticoccus sp. 23ND18S-11 TaxID=3391832 RepID=UPI0039C99B24